MSTIAGRMGERLGDRVWEREEKESSSIYSGV